LVAVLVKRSKDTRDRLEMELHSITPKALHTLLLSNQDVLVFDVRQPLDLLGDSVIIPGAKWIAPLEVRENPSLIPGEKRLVVYCTSREDGNCQNDHSDHSRQSRGSRRALRYSHTGAMQIPFVRLPPGMVGQRELQKSTGGEVSILCRTSCTRISRHGVSQKS
jgi:hypothetical protein